MKSQDTAFEGGPLDGRVLPILLGPTGHPPKTYKVPVPDAAGGPPTVLVYRRVPSGRPGKLGLHAGWKYAYDPEGDKGGDGKPRWPWSKPAAGPVPGATPQGKPDDTDG